MFDRAIDSEVRSATFSWLSEQVRIHGDVLSWAVLLQGLEFRGARVPLIGPPGIFKPKILDLPLSVTTSPETRYSDHIDEQSGLLAYSYRGTDPEHRDNRWLREAMRLRLPLVYFHGLRTGRYFATWPVLVVGDSPASLTFSIAVEDLRQLQFLTGAPAGATLTGEEREGDFRRRYVTREVLVRLHQRSFRERVIEAYRNQCALCRLRHDELLEAAHIIADSADRGEPVISNGIALCSLHHKAFDRFFIGIRPDYRIEVRPDLLLEKDGPTLLHAIQGLHGKVIQVPSPKAHRPDPDRLEARFADFQRVIGSPKSATGQLR